jgi:sec-independent protein translocase protein TatC
MVEEPAAEPLDEQEEEEGGPVKSFLEHLEDLRWVLIKSLVAAGVAMLVCLLAGNYVVRILEWPLSRAPIHQPKGAQSVRLFFGTNQIGSTFFVGTNDPLSAVLGPGQHVRAQLTPRLDGSNVVLGLTVQNEADAPAQGPRKLPVDIINLSPAGSFIVATKVALYAGLVLAAPFIFYYIAQFVFPALRMREKKYVYRGLFFATGLFMVGVSFCYFILMPIALMASVEYAEWLGFTANQWRAEEYISFVCKFMLGMGLGFELPVVVLTLVKLGVLNYRMLSNARRYVLVINFILGAVLTTPEVITQVLMALPLQLLYEISVWIAWYWERQEKKREAAEAAGVPTTT